MLIGPRYSKRTSHNEHLVTKSMLFYYRYHGIFDDMLMVVALVSLVVHFECYRLLRILQVGGKSLHSRMAECQTSIISEYET